MQHDILSSSVLKRVSSHLRLNLPLCKMCVQLELNGFNAKSHVPIVTPVVSLYAVIMFKGHGLVWLT